MLNLDPIRQRVHSGTSTPGDVNALLGEVERLYADPKPASELAAEAAALADAAAQDALKRAQEATAAAQVEAEAAAQRATTARKVSDAAQAAAAERAAELQSAADKQKADEILAQKTSVATQLKDQLAV